MSDVMTREIDERIQSMREEIARLEKLKVDPAKKNEFLNEIREAVDEITDSYIDMRKARSAVEKAECNIYDGLKALDDLVASVLTRAAHEMLNISRDEVLKITGDYGRFTETGFESWIPSDFC